MFRQPTAVSELTPATAAINSEWNSICPITDHGNAWVKLLRPPSDYAADEALILCPASLDTWVAWVPNYGEIVLDRSQFYA